MRDVHSCNSWLYNCVLVVVFLSFFIFPSCFHQQLVLFWVKSSDISFLCVSVTESLSINTVEL